MQFLEKDLEDIIFESSKEKLKEKGLNIKGKLLRQVRIGNFGIADLISFKKETSVYPEATYHHINITVYELKQNELNTNALAQASRYITGIKEYFKHRNFFTECVVEYNIVLIGSKIDKDSDFVYLCNYINNLDVYTYSYDLDGITFKVYGSWYLNNNGF